jgi:integrase
MALTDRFCLTAKPLKGARTDYFDKTITGLALRVTPPNDHRSWTFNFTSPRDDKRVRMTLGTYPATSLAVARTKALEARGLLDAGQDPRLALSGQGAAEMTVASLVAVYLADPEKSKRKSNAEIERRLMRNVVPMIGAVKLTALRKRDVKTCIEPLLRRGKATEAGRVFEDIRAAVKWAVEQEFLELNPLDGMKKAASAPPRERVLSDDEIATLWRGLPAALARSTQCQAIIRLCLATGQRVGEVAGITIAEIDLKAREWRLPASRTKNAHAHIVPLSDLAIALIKEATTAADGGEHLFPCGEGSLDPAAVARTILRAHEVSEDHPLGRFGIAPWSAHDLRRTALTGMARLGVPPIVLGHVANHRSTTRSGVTLGVYSQYNYNSERRAALDQWAERLAAIVGLRDAAEIIPFTGSAKK